MQAAAGPLGLALHPEDTERGWRAVAPGLTQGVAWQLVVEWDPSNDDSPSGTVRLHAPSLACPAFDLASARAGTPPGEVRVSGWAGSLRQDLGDSLLGRVLSWWRPAPATPADPLAGLSLTQTPAQAIGDALLQRLAGWPGRPRFALRVSAFEALSLRAELWDDTPALAFMLAWWQAVVAALLQGGVVQVREPARIRPLEPTEAAALMALIERRVDAIRSRP